jgi:hypothetical protein
LVATKKSKPLDELLSALRSLDYREQGRTDQAIDMLSKAYHGFTEGFDTPDLKWAKTLLDELQAAWICEFRATRRFLQAGIIPETLYWLECSSGP